MSDCEHRSFSIFYRILKLRYEQEKYKKLITICMFFRNHDYQRIMILNFYERTDLL